MNSAEVLITFKGDGKDVDRTSKKITSSVSSIAKGVLVATGVTKAFSAAWNMVNNSMDGAISRLDTMNNFPKVMSNLGIGAEESDKAIKTLSNRLKGLPTTLDSAALGVQRLTSKNGDVKKSTDMFLAMNNAILAGGASTEIQASAVEQLSQAYAKGKPDMMEWRTMLTAMPAQLKQVAVAMGYVDADALGEALRDGSVSMDEFMAKIVEMNEKGVAGFKSFDEQARNATGGIQTSITNMKTAVARGVANAIDGIDKALAQTPIGGISKIINNIGSNFESGLTNIGNTIGPIITGLLNGTMNVGEATQIIMDNIKGVVSNIIAQLPNTLQMLATGFAQALPVVLSGLLDMIIDLGKSVAKSLPKLIPTVIQGIVDGFATINEHFDELLKIGFDIIVGIVKGLINSIPIILKNLPTILMAIINFFTVSKLLSAGMTLLKGLGNGLIKGIPQLIKNAPKIVGSIVNAIKTDGVKGLVGVGKNLIQGLWNGIKSVKNWILSKIGGFLSGILKGIKGFFGIKSPSKVMAKEVGQWIPKGIGVGITANTDAVNKSMSNMQKEMMSTFQVSPQLANSAALHYSPNVNVSVYSTYNQDPLGQMVRDVKTFSGGAKNDYNYGMGV